MGSVQDWQQRREESLQVLRDSLDTGFGIELQQWLESMLQLKLEQLSFVQADSEQVIILHRQCVVLRDLLMELIGSGQWYEE